MKRKGDRVKFMMPGALALTVIAGLCSPASAQSMEERRDKKLAEPWVTKSAWFTDYDKAREASAKSVKPIFAYFTRSYSP